MAWMDLAWPGLLFVLVGMTALWLVSLAKRNASIVDAFWGLGFVALAWIYALASPGSARGLLLAILVSLWGVRLAAYITFRNWGEGEDYRYVAMREGWGASFWWISLLQVFVLQGVIMWIVAFPLVAAQQGGGSLWTILDRLGLLIWLIGWSFESLADLQMYRFKSDPANKGKVMDRGLWRYSRHPNYFGDALVWWGLFTIACAAPGGWMTIFSPLLMTFLLLKVSGVAMLEKTITERRPAYRDYIERTSAFVPWPPKPPASS